MSKKCPLCNKEYEGYGNNGQPVIDSLNVCDECNLTVVIPARFGIKNGDEKLVNLLKEWKNAVDELAKPEKELFEHIVFTSNKGVVSEEEIRKIIADEIESNFDTMEYLREADEDKYDWLERGRDAFGIEPRFLLQWLKYDPKDEYHSRTYKRWLEEKVRDKMYELSDNEELSIGREVLRMFVFDHEKETLTKEEQEKITNEMKWNRMSKEEN